MGETSNDQRSQPLPKGSDWLLPFLPRLRAGGRRLVEAGCGPGLDAATLTAAGFEVVAFDRAPLERAKRQAPSTMLLRADLRRPLPFRDGAFDCAVSSLALHYLPWDETRAAFGEIRRVLGEGSAFLFRVNADDDSANPSRGVRPSSQTRADESRKTGLCPGTSKRRAHQSASHRRQAGPTGSPHAS
ncbi:MAG: class I SAM-dependent methyltransferase [Dehalococcoidia bacterium]|nr:class I SAM-dependent methyltransferase [Dehalococcoidia bacterium]